MDRKEHPIIAGLFKEELQLNSFLSTAFHKASSIKYHINRMETYLSNNRADAKHMKISHICDDYKLMLDILDLSCRHYVKNVYYSEEKRSFYMNKINAKMNKEPRLYLSQVFLSFEELMVMVKKNIVELSLSIDRLKEDHVKVMDYLGKIANILDFRIKSEGGLRKCISE